MSSEPRFGRRQVIKGAAVGAAGVSLGGPTLGGAAEAAPPRVRRWLGPEWWVNRPQDWQVRGERIENVAASGAGMGRVASNLVVELTGEAAVLTVRTGTLVAGAGFSGVVLGTGVAGDDWRARALLSSAAGVGGGLIVSYEGNGRLRVRDHTSEVDQYSWPAIDSGDRRLAGLRWTGEDVELRIEIRPVSDTAAQLLARAVERRNGRLLATTQVRVSRSRLAGGVALFSHAARGSSARHWFQGLAASGAGARVQPQRGLGPVAGTLFTVADGRLRMTAQMMPVDPVAAGQVRLLLLVGGTWRQVASTTVGRGYAATFDLSGWNSAHPRSYAIVVDGYPAAPYRGVIPAEPRDRELVIASISCAKAAHRRLDTATDGRPRRPGEKVLGLYSQECIWFPFQRTVAAIMAQRPDLVVAHGDQYYENSPTVKGTSESLDLDVMGRYLLWVWAFRDLTRSVPTVVLVDDHDVYQPNLWGEGGAPGVEGDPLQGGYAKSVAWVNSVTAMQCGHDPVPADPTPTPWGIEVYYTSFRYGGVDFALLEDRKFKSAPDNPYPEEELELLGDRQERFLADWVSNGSGRPKVILSETTWAAINTDAGSRPFRDQDSNGWPKPARDRAVAIAAQGRALMLAGDQHSGAVVRHSLDGERPNGPWQFAAPAIAASYQRWWEPLPEDLLPTEGGPPLWRDAFGNLVQVHAVVQPAISRAEYAATYSEYRGDYGQRAFKREGYGIVRIDPAAQRVRLEAWPWNVDPRAPGAAPYPGFPVTVAFADL